MVHRLVLMTYAPIDRMDRYDVNHIDEDKSNNSLSNLEWISHRNNCNYGARNQKISESMIGNSRGLKQTYPQ